MGEHSVNLLNDHVARNMSQQPRVFVCTNLSVGLERICLGDCTTLAHFKSSSTWNTIYLFVSLVEYTRAYTYLDSYESLQPQTDIPFNCLWSCSERGWSKTRFYAIFCCFPCAIWDLLSIWNRYWEKLITAIETVAPCTSIFDNTVRLITSPTYRDEK